MIRAAPFLLIPITLAACAHNRADISIDYSQTTLTRTTTTDPAPLASPTISYLATTTIPSELEQFDTIGGLSALAWSGDHFAALSDRAQSPTLYQLDINLTPTDDSFELTATIAREIALDHAAQDAESIAFDPDTGAWYIGYERPPSVARLLHDPILFPIPPDVAEAFRPNRAFESLALRNDELWAATESALTIDAPEATESKGTLCRVLVWNTRTTELLRQYSYRTEPRPSSLPVGPAHHGLTEFATLPDGRLLALERSATIPAGYAARIFLIPTTAHDHPQAPLPLLDKSLLYDFADVPLLSIGNLEGMAVGPTIAQITGDPTQRGRLLLLIADDNFGRDIQASTRVIALRIAEE